MTTVATNIIANTNRCSCCNKFVSIRKMSTKERSSYKRTGMCPKCYTKKQEARVLRIKQNKESIAMKKVAAMAKRAQSAFNKIYTMLTKGIFNDHAISLLQDKTYVYKAANVSYPLIKPFNANADFKEQAYINGKARYAKRTIEINGTTYLVTNDIYHKNLTDVRDMLVSLNVISSDVAI